MVSYPALIRKESDSDFGVDFPDIPGCVTAAPSIEQALREAEDALRLHVDGMIEDGAAIPKPTPLEAALEGVSSLGATVSLIRLPPRSGASYFYPSARSKRQASPYE